MEFKTIAIPNNEAQFLETRKFQVDEISHLSSSSPPHRRSGTRDIQQHRAHEHRLRRAHDPPWLVRIEQAMNRSLFFRSRKGPFFTQFNIDGLMRGDYKSRMEGYAIARQNGWMNANDIRELENMNPIPEEEGGNAYLVNGNMISVRSAAQQAGGSENDYRKWRPKMTSS